MASKRPMGETLKRIIPMAFIIGAGMELFMTYVRIGNETFYDTAKRLEQARRVERRRAMEDAAGREQEINEKQILQKDTDTNT